MRARSGGIRHRVAHSLTGPIGIGHLLGDDPDSAALSDQFVALGDQPVCLWHDSSNPQTLCNQPEDPNSHRDCPFPAPSGVCEEEDVPDGVSVTTIAVPRTLGLFTTPEVDDDGETQRSGNPLPCELLAQYRNGNTLTAAQSDELFGSVFLTSRGFRAQASQLTTEVIAGDFMRVKFGNSVVASTGNENSLGTMWPVRGARVVGPALATPSGLCPYPRYFSAGTASQRLSDMRGYSGPLFCMEWLLGDASGNPLEPDTHRELRAATNNLLLRAVLAARIVSGAGLAGVMIPYYQPWTGTWINLDGEDFGSMPGFTHVFQSSEGTTSVDNDGDGDQPVRTSLSDRGSVAQYVADLYPEFYRISYESASGAWFNTERGGWVRGDPSPSYAERGMPFQAYTLSSAFDAPGAEAAASELWGEVGSDDFMNDVMTGDRATAPWGERVRLPRLSRLDSLDTSVPLSITRRDVLNALELTCYAARIQQPDPIDAGCANPPVFDTVRDVLRASSYLECVADRASAQAARSVIRGLPDRVVAEVRAGGGTTTGQYSGEYGAQMAEIRSALLSLRVHQSGIAGDIRQFASVLQTTRNTVDQSALAARIEDLQLERETANQVASCITSVISAAASAGDNFGAGAVGIAGAAVTCTNSVFQVVRAGEINSLRDESGALALDSAFADADRAFVSTSASLRAHVVGIAAEYARIDGALTRIRALQTRARTALSRALFLDNSTTGRALAVDTVMHRRYDTTLARYTAAHQRAVRLAFIARRALEQRLGMNLDEMEDDLLTVNAPSEWSNELCTLTPIDYERVRNSGDPTLESPDNYAGLFVGDYVRRLEQVFESYSFNYPFQDGTDTAVISVRDDIMRVMQPCETELPNLLYNSGALEVRESDSRRGWEVVGCLPPTTTPAPEDEFCVSTTASSSDSPVLASTDRYGTAQPYIVSFGTRANELTRFRQVVAVEPGRYRLSYWARSESMDIPTYKAVKVRDPISGETLPQLATVETETGGGWTRYSYFVDIAEAADVEVSVVPTSSGPVVSHVAGIQFEAAAPNFYGELFNVGGTGAAQRFLPGRFYDTGDDRRGVLPVCRDNGREFRRSAFTRGCVRVCRDGYDGTCADADATMRCFLETSIDVSSDTLQRVLTGGPAGFASGNFNYRMETVGVNLVGTGLRDCGATGSSGCFGSGNFAISMIHEGPYYVRNAVGGVYEAPLFTGRIESARALSAERYLSNPISSADMALIQPYERREFRGRPLGGTLHLRIWEDDTFRYDRLEDIQLVLNYRYWTHQR